MSLVSGNRLMTLYPIFSKLIKKILQPQYYFWLLLIALSTFFEFSGMTSVLRYERYSIEAGQWYRLVSANFVHLNNMHLVMNMLGVGLVVFFFAGQLKLLKWLMLILFSSLLVGLGLYFFNPEVKSYVGMSGVLHALFIVGAVTEIRRFPISGWMLLVVLMGKLIWEQLNGAMPGSESLIKGHVLVDSHLYGAIAGLVFIALPFVLKKLKRL